MQQPYRHPCRLAAGLAAAALALAGAWSRASDLPDLPYNSGSTGADGALSYPAQGEPTFSATQVFDMTGHPDGVWHFTSITIPAGVTVTFLKNATNTPVVWLATDDVLIAGTLNLNGQNGLAPGGTNQDPGKEAQGGPGGFAGGLGGIRYDVSMRYAGTPGQGPGGGAPGVTSTQRGMNAGHASSFTQPGRPTSPSYGNVYLQPLIGGSGAGGQASSLNSNGQNGGGGGGAILIASSRDLTVSGSIQAEPGAGSDAAYERGSGGSTRLVADRISGDGRISVGGNGRVRLEAFYHLESVWLTSVSPSKAAPTATLKWPGASERLRIVMVNGSTIAQPPLGGSTLPDVVFHEAGEIVVRVEGDGVPDNTPIWIHVTTASTIIETSKTASTLANGMVDIPVTVPTGLGTIQAFANYTITPVE